MKKIFKTIFCAVFSLAIIFSSISAGYSVEGLYEVSECHVELLQESGFLADTKGETPAPEQSLENVILAGLRDVSSEISLVSFNVSVDTMKETYSRVVNLHPDLFYVAGSFRYRHTGGANDIATALLPNYTSSDKAEIAAMQQEYNDRINRILAGVDSSWSDLEKVVYIHDYLGIHFAYDYTYTVSDAYSFLTGGVGVCQAYSLTFVELMNRLGIAVDIFTSESMNHAWNAVRVGGKWYHVDNTWDDNSNYYGDVNHNHLLLSDTGIGTNHSGWVGTASPNLKCSDTSYENRVWVSSETPMAAIGHDWYYVAKSGSSYKLMKTDGTFLAGTPVLDLNYNWRVIGKTSVWIGFFSGLTTVDGQVVYNTERAILAYDPVTGKTDCLRTLTPEVYETCGIYGFTFDDQLVYSTMVGPNDGETDRVAASLPAPLDANADGIADARDVACFRMYLNGNYDLPLSMNGADMDGDGILSVSDSDSLRSAMADWADPADYGTAGL